VHELRAARARAKFAGPRPPKAGGPCSSRNFMTRFECPAVVRVLLLDGRGTSPSSAARSDSDELAVRREHDLPHDETTGAGAGGKNDEPETAARARPMTAPPKRERESRTTTGRCEQLACGRSEFHFLETSRDTTATRKSRLTSAYATESGKRDRAELDGRRRVADGEGNVEATLRAEPPAGSPFRPEVADTREPLVPVAAARATNAADIADQDGAEGREAESWNARQRRRGGRPCPGGCRDVCPSPPAFPRFVAQ